MAPMTTLKIAVLLVPPVQLLDMSPVDLFHMMSRQYLTECRLPQPLINLGLEDVQIMYVGEDGPVPSPKSSNSASLQTPAAATEVRLAEMTASCSVRLTHSLESPMVRPGTVDILFVPGPDPSIVPSERVKAFVRSHAVMPNTTILSVCTGIYVLGYSGVLDNKTVTGPRALIGMELKKKFPKAIWSEKRWEVDQVGRLWTAGGITNGQDMVAAYLRAKVGGDLSEMVCKFADVGDRGQEYGSSSVAEGGWFVWLIARSWFKGLISGGAAKSDAKVRTE